MVLTINMEHGPNKAIFGRGDVCVEEVFSEFPINRLLALCSFGQDCLKRSSISATLWSFNPRGRCLGVGVKVIGMLSLRRMNSEVRERECKRRVVEFFKETRKK